MAEFLDLQTWSILIAIFVSLAGFAFTVIIYIRKTRKDDADKIEATREREAAKLNALKEAEALRIKAEKEEARKALEQFTEQMAEKLERAYEAKHKQLADEILSLKKLAIEQLDSANKNLKRQWREIKRGTKHAGWTNSNVAKVRRDRLNDKRTLRSIVKALMKAKFIEPGDDSDAEFEREMAREEAEIANDEQTQIPVDPDPDDDYLP